MVGLDKSWVVPLTVMLVVPLCLVGILPMLYLTGSGHRPKLAQIGRIQVDNSQHQTLMS
jgi:multidrug efflux pump subunit AcrB